MKTKFNDFLNEDKTEDAKKWLLEQPYIKADEKTGELLVVQAGSWGFPDNIIKLSKRKYDTLYYKTLMRFLLYGWIYKYQGENETLLKIRTDMLNYDDNNEFLRPFTQIPTNNKVMHSLKSFVKISSTDTTDKLLLATLLAKKDEIFTEENVVGWYNTVKGLTDKADQSEQNTIDFINKFNLFANPIAATDADDKNGIDLWFSPIIKNTVRQPVPAQVKEPADAVDIKMFYGDNFYEKDGKKIPKKPEFVIMIQDTLLDFHRYIKRTDGDLIWKFLFLWDHKHNKLYQINSSTINSIFKDKGNNVYINTTMDEKWLPRMMKVYDIETGKLDNDFVYREFLNQK